MFLRATITAGLVAAANAQAFEDTPITTEMWQLISKSDESKNDEALEGFLYRNPDAITVRSVDRRGGLWWAWEFKNSFALAALKAYGADPLVKLENDEGVSETPKEMCDEDCDELLEGIDAKVEEILKRKKERAVEEERAMDLDDDDDDDDEDEAPASKKSVGAADSGSIDEDDDDDL